MWLMKTMRTKAEIRPSGNVNDNWEIRKRMRVRGRGLGTQQLGRPVWCGVDRRTSGQAESEGIVVRGWNNSAGQAGVGGVC